MFDMHYDLLTLAYLTGPNNFQKKYLFDEINTKKGITANLYFMSQKENAKELNYPKTINVLQIFKKAKRNLESYKPKPQLLYSIEGCDYIKNTQELKKLKKEGLNSIILVWNNKNKYGSGNRSKQGLTKQGKQFIKEAIKLNLGIDLSHANKKTFKGIIQQFKKAKRNKPVCYASHSNIKKLYNHPRNLSIHQLKQLKKVGGYLGLVPYPSFLTNDKKRIKESYINNILQAIKIMGIDHVFLSTDNMDFLNDFTENTSDKSPYPYKTIEYELKIQLKKYLNKTQIEKIMYKNAHEIYIRLKTG